MVSADQVKGRLWERIAELAYRRQRVSPWTPAGYPVAPVQPLFDPRPIDAFAKSAKLAREGGFPNPSSRVLALPANQWVGLWAPAERRVAAVIFPSIFAQPYFLRVPPDQTDGWWLTSVQQVIFWNWTEHWHLLVNGLQVRHADGFIDGELRITEFYH